MAFTDRDVLLALFRSAGGPNWSRKQNWDTDAELSKWDGVWVDGQGRVVKLDLRENNLQGDVMRRLLVRVHICRTRVACVVLYEKVREGVVARKCLSHKLLFICSLDSFLDYLYCCVGSGK